jgi:hypothetical protein
MRTIRQLAIGLAALGSTALGGSLALPATATAGVSVGIGIGVPGPAFYGTYRIRTGLCSRPRFAFNHPGRCGYPRYSEPVFIDGVWVNEPLYYRVYGGQRYFWSGGRWVIGHGSWDGRVFRGDWRRTWHERGWDRADMRDRMEDRRDNMHDRMEDRRDNMQDRMEDKRDNMRDRMEDRRDNMQDKMQDRREDMRGRDRDDNGPNGRDRDNGPNGRDRDNDNDNGRNDKGH